MRVMVAFLYIRLQYKLVTFLSTSALTDIMLVLFSSLAGQCITQNKPKFAFYAVMAGTQ